MARSRKVRFITGGLLAAISVLAAIGIVAFYALGSHDAPESVTLSQAVQQSAGTQTAGSTGNTGDQANDLTGTWTIAANGASFVGYRVKEELARIGAFTAVGRTGNITGTLRFDGSAITDVQVSADLTTLKSDSNLRDNALRTQALETARFPTATFTLAEPIVLNGVPADGTPVKATAVGDLTIHGVTRRVSLDLEGQRSNGLIVVIGSTEIVFADYGISKPRAAAVLAVEDRGVLELQLVFEKSGTRS